MMKSTKTKTKPHRIPTLTKMLLVFSCTSLLSLSALQGQDAPSSKPTVPTQPTVQTKLINWILLKLSLPAHIRGVTHLWQYESLGASPEGRAVANEVGSGLEDGDEVFIFNPDAKDRKPHND